MDDRDGWKKRFREIRAVSDDDNVWVTNMGQLDLIKDNLYLIRISKVVNHSRE